MLTPISTDSEHDVMRWPILLLAGAPAFADPKPLPKDRVGVDASFVLPVDEYGDEADGGIGALVRYERRLGSQLLLAARGGPLFHAMNVDGHSLTMLLAFAGMRYNLEPDQESSSFFTMAIGVNYVRAGAKGMGVDVSDSEPELTLDIGGGFQVRKVQVRGSIFYTPHVGASFGGNDVSYLGLGLTIGYDVLTR
jgi:hypothetical protein